MAANVSDTSSKSPVQPFVEENYSCPWIFVNVSRNQSKFLHNHLDLVQS